MAKGKTLSTTIYEEDTEMVQKLLDICKCDNKGLDVTNSDAVRAAIKFFVKENEYKLKDKNKSNVDQPYFRLDYAGFKSKELVEETIAAIHKEIAIYQRTSIHHVIRTICGSVCGMTIDRPNLNHLKKIWGDVRQKGWDHRAFDDFEVRVEKDEKSGLWYAKLPVPVLFKDREMWL